MVENGLIGRINGQNLFKIAIFFGLLFLMVAPATAWEWTAHKKIVDEININLPSDVQKNLKPYLAVMKEGSTYPDTLPNDKINHGYPGSYSQTNTWLDNGKVAYEKGDYREAAWCFGVASHYITDTYSAPHCGWIKDKEKYWQIGNQLTPKKHDFHYSNLNNMLKYGNERGKDSIASWNKTEDSGIVQQDLNRGVSAAYIAILYHAHPSMLQNPEYYDES
ncbi:zinc dependent phospholipase C family protein [Methanobacterium formicicum]|uniref:Zinc-dependent phospholipase n=1 Tax=Methanobacterium formicicum TaxID=2162 RepID=A0A089ZVG2_METFO|nr:zinc dependent phospholipase C family protein [Methanobacterium formicicum]AIS32379.1 zinc-dependent phospholipase [Methanobacterium formicicum]